MLFKRGYWLIDNALLTVVYKHSCNAIRFAMQSRGVLSLSQCVIALHCNTYCIEIMFVRRGKNTETYRESLYSNTGFLLK